MAKSKNRKKNTSRRDVVTSHSITNRRLPRSVLSLVSPVPYLSPLTHIEDRRLWHPEGRYAPARSFSRSRHRLTIVSGSSRSHVSRRSRGLPSLSSLPAHRIGFEQPERVLICVRRKMRREVLHALRKTGRVGQRRPRRNWYSSISCRR